MSFLCETCLKAGYANKPSERRSLGPCEDCGKQAVCSDIASNSLRPKPKPCMCCKGRPGWPQPSDGDAAMVFAAAAHVPNGAHGDVVLCVSCQVTIEGLMARIAAGGAPLKAQRAGGDS